MQAFRKMLFGLMMMFLFASFGLSESVQDPDCLVACVNDDCFYGKTHNDSYSLTIDVAPQAKPGCAAEIRRCRAECPYITRCNSGEQVCGTNCCLARKCNAAGACCGANDKICGSTCCPQDDDHC